MPDMIAERLLRLFASREDASTIAGDLQEIAVVRGKLWFWVVVARSVPSLLWRDLKSEPLFRLGLAVRGLLVTVCLGSLIGFLTIGLPFGLAPSAGFRHPVAFAVVWLSSTALVQFVTGLYLASKSRGRLVAAILAYIAVYNAIRLGIVFMTVASRAGLPPEGALSAHRILTFLRFAPLFLGAITARLRHRHTLSNA